MNCFSGFTCVLIQLCNVDIDNSFTIVHYILWKQKGSLRKKVIDKAQVLTSVNKKKSAAPTSSGIFHDNAQHACISYKGLLVAYNIEVFAQSQGLYLCDWLWSFLLWQTGHSYLLDHILLIVCFPVYQPYLAERPGTYKIQLSVTIRHGICVVSSGATLFKSPVLV